MKRKVLVCSLVCAVLLLVCALALAEYDPVTCKISISPTKLTAPGTVDVTITISNSGDGDMTDPVTLYGPDGKAVSDFGSNGAVTLGVGASQTYTGKWKVTQTQLEKGAIYYFVKYYVYSDSGEQVLKRKDIRAKITYENSVVDLDVKRTITPSVARKGQKVKITYDITNTGTVTLKTITVKENTAISKKSASIATLEAGKTERVQFDATMGTKNLTSSATVTYKTASSSKTQTKKVESATIAYGEASLSAKLAASATGVPLGDTVKLTLTLKNNGTIDYSNVRATDATLGEVFSGIEVKKGETKTLEKELTMLETTEYKFTIAAIDNTNTEITLDTESVRVAAVDPNKKLEITLNAKVDKMTVYENPATVRFTVTITNASEVDATDVTISHGDTRLYTYSTLYAGTTRTLTRDASITNAGKYQFTAATKDQLGNSAEFKSNEIFIGFSTPTSVPTTMAPATPPPLITERVPTEVTLPPYVETSRQGLWIVGIVSAVLLAGSVGLLGFAAVKRGIARAKSNAAIDHIERPRHHRYGEPADMPEEGVELAPDDAVRAAATEDAADTADADDLGDIELPHLKYMHAGDTAPYADQPLSDDDVTMPEASAEAEPAPLDSAVPSDVYEPTVPAENAELPPTGDDSRDARGAWADDADSQPTGRRAARHRRTQLLDTPPTDDPFAPYDAVPADAADAYSADSAAMISGGTGEYRISRAGETRDEFAEEYGDAPYRDAAYRDEVFADAPEEGVPSEPRPVKEKAPRKRAGRKDHGATTDA